MSREAGLVDGRERQVAVGESDQTAVAADEAVSILGRIDLVADEVVRVQCRVVDIGQNDVTDGEAAGNGGLVDGRTLHVTRGNEHARQVDGGSIGSSSQTESRSGSGESEKNLLHVCSPLLWLKHLSTVRYCFPVRC